MPPSFQEQWSSKLEEVPQRVTPWERHKLPVAPDSPTEADIVAYLEVAQPLIERGRWWYFLMGAVRAFKSVLSKRLGRHLVLLCFAVVHQVYANLYLQSFEFRAQSVGGVGFRAELSHLDVLFPWLGAWDRRTNELLERHQHAVELYHRADSIGWWGLRLEYPYERVQKYEELVSLSQRLHPTVLELEEQAKEMGWDLEIRVFPTRLRRWSAMSRRFHAPKCFIPRCWT